MSNLVYGDDNRAEEGDSQRNPSNRRKHAMIPSGNFVSE
jgi:hypothetical protein